MLPKQEENDQRTFDVRGFTTVVPLCNLVLRRVAIPVGTGMAGGGGALLLFPVTVTLVLEEVVD